MSDTEPRNNPYSASFTCTDVAKIMLKAGFLKFIITLPLLHQRQDFPFIFCHKYVQILVSLGTVL